MTILVTFGVALTLLNLGACGDSPERLYLTGTTMGTGYAITIEARDRRTLNNLHATVEARLAEIIAATSTYVPDSEISKFNNDRSTDWISMSNDFATVVSRGIEIGQASDGAFDITLGRLVDLWGFGPRPGPASQPDEESVAAAHANSGSDLLALSPNGKSVRKLVPELALDLSGIAKGYAVDEIVRILTGRGLSRFLVEIGGEVRAVGRRADGRPWQIGIESPTRDNPALTRVVGLENHALATSGSYRNFIEWNGQRHSHILKPRTGLPAGGSLAAVTVAAATAMDADAWATALMSAGTATGIEMAQAQGLAAVFVAIGADNVTVTETPAFKVAFGNN